MSLVGLTVKQFDLSWYLGCPANSPLYGTWEEQLYFEHCTLIPMQSSLTIYQEKLLMINFTNKHLNHFLQCHDLFSFLWKARDTVASTSTFLPRLPWLWNYLGQLNSFFYAKRCIHCLLFLILDKIVNRNCVMLDWTIAKAVVTNWCHKWNIFVQWAYTSFYLLINIICKYFLMFSWS